MNRFRKELSKSGRRWMGVAALALGMAAAGAIPAQAAPTPFTPIGSCSTKPFVISKAGFYRVTATLTAAMDKDCIDVKASNVVLDLHGFQLIGNTHIASGASGVDISSSSQFVVLEGANSFIGAFDIGIQDQGSYATIEDLNGVNNYTTGIWLNGPSYSQLSNTDEYSANIPGQGAIPQLYGVRVTLAYSAAVAVGIIQNNSIYGLWLDRSNATRVNNIFSENNNNASIYLGCADDGYISLGTACPMSKTYGGNLIFDDTTDNDDPLGIGGGPTQYGIAVDESETGDRIFQNESLGNNAAAKGDINAADDPNCTHNLYFLNNSPSNPGFVNPACVGNN
jgi:hypothetical protein